MSTKYCKRPREFLLLFGDGDSTAGNPNGGSKKKGNGGKSALVMMDDDNEAEQTKMRSTAIQRMLERFTSEFGECACGIKDGCLIERLEHELLSFSNERVTQLDSALLHSQQLFVAAVNNIEAHDFPETDSVDDENIGIDEIAMPPSSAVETPTSLDQVNKKSHSSDGDIDIGDNLPVTTLLLDTSNTEQQTFSSFSSISNLSATEPVAVADADDDSSADVSCGMKKNEYVTVFWMMIQRHHEQHFLARRPGCNIFYNTR
ncbi:hypothetical protein BCR42DRAFT_114730 [Absidia repens]|uniref:Uncharacterized protein n=1 Tax=Absidia repens TaxID=90262 RepID=A0A1X2I677_9FUNG|nr:hypothetical protein BCR42DRAFT_114730 [Absidia repens]